MRVEAMRAREVRQDGARRPNARERMRQKEYV